MNAERSLRLHDSAWSPVAISRGPALALLALLATAALLVCQRRWVGALERPLEPTWLLAAGLLIALMAGTVRWGWFFHARPTVAAHTAAWSDGLVMGLTSGAVVALWVGVCVPGTAAVGLFGWSVVLGVEESLAWAWFLQRDKRSAQVAEASQTVPNVQQIRLSTPSATLAPIPSDLPAVYDKQSEAVLDEPPSEVTQQLTRCQTADGADRISGWLRAAFAAGQRTASVHVAFCPPFAAMPELEAEQIDGPDARVKTAQLWPYGARLDLKLSAPAEEPTDVLLQFLAKTERNQGTRDVERGA